MDVRTVLFYSPAFLPFFVIVFGLYWLMPWQAARTWLLLIASFYFYATWNHWLALLIGVTSVADYVVARWLDASANRTWRNVLLGGSLVMNLGLLAYFKYANFFLDSLEASLAASGVRYSMPTLQVILPIGISFYTFEAINYTVDVYRKRMAAERNLSHFLLFITFFPHLVAGPIVRAKEFLPQIKKTKRWDWFRFQVGAEYFLLGLVKKLAIADRLSMAVDPVFADPDAYKTGAVWLAVLGYSVQIYCDFSGYSDMAIGLAHMFGFKLGLNFNMPYVAANLSEFWRRWHISLSSWLRDYLFIPLGGSRGPRWRTNLNLMITMTLGGLWHGASWTFVVWGVLHGSYQIVQRWIQDICRWHPLLTRFSTSPVGYALSMASTFLAVSIAWIFFRAPSFEIAGRMLKHMFIPHHGRGLLIPSQGIYMILAVVVVAHLIGQWKPWREGRFRRLPAPVVGFGYAVLLAGMLLLVPEAVAPFIYFQF